MLGDMNDKYLFALSGSRKSGKSTLLKEIKTNLEQQDQRVFFVDLKNPKNLMKLNENFDYISELIGTINKNKATVIIDDIDLMTHPQNMIESIKLRYLDFVNIIVSYTQNEKLDLLFIDEYSSGSNYFNLKSLSFNEFLAFKGFGDLLENSDGFLDIREIELRNLVQLRVLFSEFIKYGAYPEVVLTEQSSEKEELLSAFINSLLQNDIQGEGIKDISKLYLLLKLLAEKSGELLNSNECAKNLNVSITAIENYLKVLERLSIISRVKPFYNKYEKELKKMPIIYFNDLGIRNSILGIFDSVEDRFDKENYFKNVLFKLLSDNNRVNTIKFWRTQSRHQIDFIIDEKIAIESKFNPRLFKDSKYNRFRGLYPDINLYFAGYKDNSEGILSVFDLV